MQVHSRKFRFPIIASAVLFLALPVFACKKGDKKTDTASTAVGEGTGEDGDDGSIENVQAGQVALSQVIPSDLVLESPFSSETPTQALQGQEEYLAARQVGQVGVATALNLQNPPPDQNQQQPLQGGFVKRKANLAKILYSATTAAECVFPEEMQGLVNPSCYGPSLKYRNHPDGTDPAGAVDGQIETYPGIGSGDLGFWTALASEGDACVASKMNGVVGDTSSKVNNAIGFSAMLLCLARVEGDKKVPAPGEELDLSGLLAKAKEVAGNQISFTFDAATVKNVAAAGSELPIYETTLTYSKSVSTAEGNYNRQYEVVLKHNLLDAQGETYKGLVQIVESNKDADPNTQCQGSDQQLDMQTQKAISIVYEKKSEDLTLYESRQGGWLPGKTKSDMFDQNGFAKLPGVGDCNRGGEYGIYSLNPTQGTGKVAFSWIAGTTGEVGRSFVTEVSLTGEGTDAKKTGCGYFGMATTLASVLQERESLAPGGTLQFINEFRCNWAGPGADPNVSAKQLVQKQCMEQDGTTGKYVPTTNNLAFAPVNDCEVDVSSTFELYEQVFGQGTQPTWTKITTNVTAHELLSIDGVPANDLKSPTPPML